MRRVLVAVAVLLAACTGTTVEEPPSEVDEPTATWSRPRR